MAPFPPPKAGTRKKPRPKPPPPRKGPLTPAQKKAAAKKMVQVKKQLKERRAERSMDRSLKAAYGGRTQAHRKKGRKAVNRQVAANKVTAATKAALAKRKR